MKYLLLVASLLFSQTPSSSFLQGDCKQTISQLEKKSQGKWKKSSSMEEEMVLLAECYAKEKTPTKTKTITNKFSKFYTASPYQDRMLFVQARTLLQEGHVLRGVQELYKILNLSTSAQVHKEVKNQTLKVLQKNILKTQELQLLLDQYPKENILVAELLYQVATRAKEEGKTKTARYALKRLIGELPNSTRAKDAKILLTSLKSGNGTPILLVLAPLTGDFSSFGTDVVQGVVLALENSSKKVSYRVLDTQGEAALAVRKTRDILRQENVIGIVGPIISSTASALAAWLSVAYPHIPMVTPTATDEGIAQLGDNIFQFNLPTSVLARSIAQYATRCQKDKEFAILAPNTAYGEIMAKVFTQNVEAAGGQIIGTEFYNEGEADYQKNFDVLRTRKYAQMQDRYRIAVGISLDKAYKNTKSKMQFLQDSTVRFDGIFIAASDPADAALLAKQTDFYKIEAQLYGSSGWYGKSTIRSGRKYVNKAFFTAPFLENKTSENWLDFRQKYGKRWNSYPGTDRVAGLSFEAAKFILQSYSPDKTLINLRSVQNISSIYGDMFLSPSSGGNEKAHLVQILNGKFQLKEYCQD